MLSFKEFLSESPYFERSAKPSFVNHMISPLMKQINDTHSSSENIGKSDEGTYHRQEVKGLLAYYHYVDNKPREVSFINDKNEQQIVSKNGGDSSHIHNFIKRHIDEFGEAKSSDSNTKGSKKIWRDAVDTYDPKKYSAYHSDGKSENRINSDYLDKNEDTIWNSTQAAKNHRIIIRKNV